MERAFVIRPFGKKKDSSGTEIDFETVHSKLIGPALDACKLGGGTTGEIVESGNIREDMFSLILEADLVVCDFTVHNANVFYELGIRHALRKRHTILIRGDKTADNVVFDLLTDRYLTYDVSDPAKALPKLVETIEATLRTDRDTDSPIFRMLPRLAEADPDRVQVVPLDFLEEVERARAAGSKGWLRLLAQDVRGRRFQWPGLRMVADAQWKLKDLEGARESLKTILEANEGDPGANHMLANIYERLYRVHEKAELLEASDQAIERVLASPRTEQAVRVDALAMKGRNQKTLWRREFEKGDESLEERRKIAMNQKLRDSYAAYRAAFYEDLNAFYPGLAALQMGMIFLELTSIADDASWKFSFDDEAAADEYRAKLAKQVESLRAAVSASLEAHLKPGDVWGAISNADLLFMFEKSADRVVRRYNDAFPVNDRFAWDAAKGQLELFAAVGFRADLAQKVIAAIDSQQKQPPPRDRPLHLVLFAGHRVDVDPTRRRFPPERVEDARKLIEQVLGTPGENVRMEAMASGAPGGDILFHEVCTRLDIPCSLCLPMPADRYAAEVFGTQDDWRSRFQKLRQDRPILELSDREGLPRWLEGSGANPWERGNRWVLEMARTSDAREITLIALWDGEEGGGEPGGTAHMVKIARDSGAVNVKIIDSKQLLT